MESEHRPADMSETRADQGGQVQVEESPAAWPNIADYWPDAPHRIGPAADLHEDPGAAPTRIQMPLHVEMGPAGPAGFGVPAPPRRRRRVFKPLLGVALTALLLGSGAVAYHRLTARATSAPQAQAASSPPTEAASVPAPALPAPAVVMPSPSPTPSASAGAPSGTRSSAPPAADTPLPAAATFDLVSDLDELTVSVQRLDQGVAEVGTPPGSNAVPRASMVGAVLRLAADTRGDTGKPQVVVRLDSRIAWSIRIDGGVRHLAVDMADGKVRRFDLNGGATRIDLALPRLTGLLPIRMTGGVNTWRIDTDGQVAVQVLVRKGAGRIVLYGRDRGGVGHGKTVRSLAGGRGAIVVDAVGGIGKLTVAAA